MYTKKKKNNRTRRAVDRRGSARLSVGFFFLGGVLFQRLFFFRRGRAANDAPTPVVIPYGPPPFSIHIYTPSIYSFAIVSIVRNESSRSNFKSPIIRPAPRLSDLYEVRR